MNNKAADCIIGDEVAGILDCWVRSCEEKIPISKPEGVSPQKS